MDVYSEYTTIEISKIAISGDWSKIKSILMKYNISPDYIVNSRDGKYLLHYAAIQGNLDVIRELIKYGCDLSVLDDQGQSPLQLACLYGHIDVVKVLLESGSDPNLIDNRDCTAIHYTVRSTKSEVILALIIDILVKYGADINAIGVNNIKSREIVTCRDLATLYSKHKLAKTIIGHGGQFSMTLHRMHSLY